MINELDNWLSILLAIFNTKKIKQWLNRDCLETIFCVVVNMPT
jgi:hypothetical protein